MMYWHDGGMNGWGIGLMTVSMLFFWALVVFGVVALVRYVRRALAAPPAAAVPPERPTPEQLLAERLARGEIDPDDYRSRLETLRGGGAPPASG
ncbi:SHOCT domain-containing protein [Streptomyces kaniharaensis]|uniref:SHOCT domain-containing protein n=1 Tax=Streptomyces kaniharaensis TaxID=212423 RepID=A0A6N7L194_9ACTN|nr:SHOCT domain-containing protein [Streptomyces kaniharaensis]MQS16905.1 SHOCT domain-containing protein [Streptomyces kaniharaensis]